MFSALLALTEPRLAKLPDLVFINFSLNLSRLVLGLTTVFVFLVSDTVLVVLLTAGVTVLLVLLTTGVSFLLDTSVTLLFCTVGFTLFIFFLVGGMLDKPFFFVDLLTFFPPTSLLARGTTLP